MSAYLLASHFLKPTSPPPLILKTALEALGGGEPRAPTFFDTVLYVPEIDVREPGL